MASVVDVGLKRDKLAVLAGSLWVLKDSIFFHMSRLRSQSVEEECIEDGAVVVVGGLMCKERSVGGIGVVSMDSP